MTLLPGKVPYTAPPLGLNYNRTEIRTALGALARSVPPMSTRNVVAAYTPTAADDTIVCDTTGGSFAVTLPPVAQVQFLKLTIVNIGANTVTVTGTVSGSVNPTLAQWKSMTVQSDGVRWFKIAAV